MVSFANQGERGDLHALPKLAPGVIGLHLRRAEQEVGNGHTPAPVGDPQALVVIAPAVGLSFIKGVLDNVSYRFPLSPLLAPGGCWADDDEPKALRLPVFPIVLHGEDSWWSRSDYHYLSPFALAIASWKAVSSLSR
ncbi:hypothetical protein ES703_80184 [subsurface metagenome]